MPQSRFGRTAENQVANSAISVCTHDDHGRADFVGITDDFIRRITDQPVSAVFNTHVHGDHWLGNQAIRDAYPGAVIYGHAKMLEMVDAGEGDSWVRLMMQLTNGKSAGTLVVGPTEVAGNGLEVAIGGFTFRVHRCIPSCRSTGRTYQR